MNFNKQNGSVSVWLICFLLIHTVFKNWLNCWIKKSVYFAYIPDSWFFLKKIWLHWSALLHGSKELELSSHCFLGWSQELSSFPLPSAFQTLSWYWKSAAVYHYISILLYVFPWVSLSCTMPAVTWFVITDLNA